MSEQLIPGEPARLWTCIGQPRARAWRNCMVAAINAGLEQRLFSLAPDDNRWGVGAPTFAFSASRIPALGWVDDIGHGELAVHVVFWPTADAGAWIDACGIPRASSRPLVGEAIAAGWLERERGAWLQTSTSLFTCRNVRLAEIAALRVDPLGFEDRGRVVM